MADNDINLTYETLFDITRREKLQEDLQKLDDNFFENLVKYVGEKTKHFEKAPQGNLFSRNEKAATQKQLENIRKLISELYTRRERKIVNLAIIKSRTNSRLIDTSSLLEQEKSLFALLLKIMNKSKQNILYNLLQGKIPQSLSSQTQNQQSQQYSEVDSRNKMNKPEIKSELKPPQPVETKPEISKKELENARKVRFLGSVPKFVGKELEIYGPYEKEDVANLPLDIANMLINKGTAEEIKQS